MMSGEIWYFPKSGCVSGRHWDGKSSPKIMVRAKRIRKQNFVARALAAMKGIQ